MKAYSLDLRVRVVAAFDHGMSRDEIATTFGVSRSSISRWRRQQRKTGTLAPGVSPGRPAHKGDALDRGIVVQLRAHPDATVAEHCQFWQETSGEPVSEATMRRAIHRARWSFKKSN